MNIFCEIYRCSKREGLYLYVKKGQDLASLPEALIASLGTTTHTMSLTLNKERKLARVDVEEVMSKLGELGYFLQMPPAQNREPALQPRVS